MNKRYHVMALIIEVMLVLTACSSGGQVILILQKKRFF